MARRKKYDLLSVGLLAIIFLATLSVNVQQWLLSSFQRDFFPHRSDTTSNSNSNSNTKTSTTNGKEFSFEQLQLSKEQFKVPYGEISDTHTKQQYIEVAAHSERNERINNIYKTKYKYHPPSIDNTERSGSRLTAKKSIHPLCGSAPDFRSFFSMDHLLRSRRDEDLIMYETFFEDNGKGGTAPPYTYVELGGFDGVEESNTRFFDLCLNWEGLLIEGNPKTNVYDRLIANRPNSHRMNYVPSCNQVEEDRNATIPFHSRVFSNSDIEAPELGVDNHYTGVKDDTVGAPCGTLSQVLLDIFPPHGRVSFFSLDVEGSEHLVLEKALDFDKVMIEMLMVEVSNSICWKAANCESRNEVRRVMKESKKYARFTGPIPQSDVYIHQDSNLLAKALKAGWKEHIYKE